MLIFLKVLMVSVFFSMSSFAQETKEAGKFDAYVLSMSYMNDFCATHKDKKECKNHRFERPEMALHGLWPNLHDDPKHTYQYCGISQSEFGKDWCASKYDVKGKIKTENFDLLSMVMPGTQSCLYNHEWYAHGTCSGLTPDSYFKASAQLAKSFISLKNFNNVLAQSYGKTITRFELLDALNDDLGEAAADAVVIQCRKMKAYGSATPKAYFSEVHITLDVNHYQEFPVSTSLGVSEPFVSKDGEKKKDLGSCPAEGIILTADGIEAGTPPVTTGEKVKNPCPCSEFPGKSFCRSVAFSLNADGTITNYKADGSFSVFSGKTYSRVQDFIDDQVCK